MAFLQEIAIIVNRSSRLVRTSLGLLVASAVLFSACATIKGEGQVWLPANDLAYYQALYGEQRGENSVYPAYLGAAIQSSTYRNNAAKAASQDCSAWVSLQVISVDSPKYEFSFFCRSDRGVWTAKRGGAVEAGLADLVAPGEALNDVLARAPYLEGVYAKPVFDAPCAYLTTFDGKRVARFAVYPAVPPEEGLAGKFAAASSMIMKLQNLPSQVSRNPIN